MDLESALARLRTLAQTLLNQHRHVGVSNSRTHSKAALLVSATEFKGAYDIIGHLIGGFSDEQRRFEYRQIGAPTEVHDMLHVYLAAMRKAQKKEAMA